MQFEADAFTARLGANAEFDPQQQLRVTYSSTVAPGSTMQYDVTSKTYEVLKVAPVPNYDATLYDTERLEVPARDGVKISHIILAQGPEEAKHAHALVWIWVPTASPWIPPSPRLA